MLHAVERYTHGLLTRCDGLQLRLSRAHRETNMCTNLANKLTYILLWLVRLGWAVKARMDSSGWGVCLISTIPDLGGPDFGKSGVGVAARIRQLGRPSREAGCFQTRTLGRPLGTVLVLDTMVPAVPLAGRFTVYSPLPQWSRTWRPTTTLTMNIPTRHGELSRTKFF